MYKRITEGQTLTVTGFNLYPDTTAVFFNNTGNQVPTQTGSYNSDFTQVGITVPCCLPDLNDLIVFNGINYVTGDSQYRFYGKPTFSGLNKTSAQWGEDVLVKGSYLHQTTGVTVDNLSAEFYSESQNSVVFTMPQDTTVGSGRDVIIKTKGGQFTAEIAASQPPIEGALDLNSSSVGLRFGESGFVQGKSLDIVNRVVVSGFSQELYLEGADLVHSGSSGLSFAVPTATINGLPVKLQNQSGFYSSGNYNQTITDEAVTTNNLKIVSPYISNVSTGAAKFQDTVTVNGSQVENCKVLFSGFDQTHVEGTSVTTGLNSNEVSVPRGIVRSKLIISGYTGGTTGTFTSPTFFYPVPTITGLSTTNFVVGQQVTVDAINAAQARALIGINGNDKVRGAGVSNVPGKYIVSSPTSYAPKSAREYGSATLNNSSLSHSIATGITKITATINAGMIGNGSPFLVSIHEGGGLNSIQTFSDKLINIPNYDSVTVSGNPNSIIGVSRTRVTNTDHIIISGNNLMNAYSLSLSDGSETKTITSGSFLQSGLVHPFVTFTNTGNDNYNYQTHSVSIDLSAFSYTGESGSFTFLTASP